MNGHWDADRRTPETAPAGYAAGVRIGDAERERAVSALGEHFAVGRLTRDELDDRLERAWDAKTAADLQPLFVDLPGDGIATRPAAAAVSASRLYSRAGRPGFPVPLLVIVAVLLTIVTHVPFVLFLVGWFVLGRLFHGGVRQPYALRR